MCYSFDMNKLRNNQGFSRIEVICIAGIVCFAVVLAAVLGWHMLSLMWQGNDANALNTAQGVANASLAASSDETDLIYYDKGANTLVADPPAGYNEGDTLVIDGREQHVERGTCIIKIIHENGAATAQWVLVE